jgi:type IV pilus assembly protein PilC
MKYHFTIQDQIFFSQKLALLIDSGISLSESIEIIRDMNNKKKQRIVFDFLVQNIQQGISLSKAIILSGAKFDQLFISLVQTGEYSGSLVSALQYIHQNLDKRNELQKKVITTLIYPAFIMFATIAMTLFLIMFIFPKILPLLDSLHIQLPFLTRLVKALYINTIAYGLQTGIALLIILSIIILLINKIYIFRKVYHYILLKIPLINSYLKLRIITSICSTNEMLLSSGVSLYSAHDFSYESTKNIIFKKAFKEIRAESRKGISLTNSLNKFNHLFPSTLIQMCSIGEKTGNLAIMFGHTARIFEQDMDILLKRFSSLIEPVLMIAMGVIVGSIALSIILPIYEITNHLTH